MKAGIIGASGYAGAELCRLLAMHPQVEKIFISSTSFEGKRVSEVYANFLKRIDINFENADDVIQKSDIIFAALPAGLSEDIAKKCFDGKKHFIDISADFRFDEDALTYEEWYGKPYKYPDLHKVSVYGLPEMNRDKIKAAISKSSAPSSVIIGNPGCYPTSVTLGAMPALKEGIAGEGTIIADCASGVSGGGREPSRAYHYPECADNVSPYKVGVHRHTPEISRNLSIIEGRERYVIFTPHLVPMNRGILSTVYIPLQKKSAVEEIHALYCAFYKNEFFVRVLPGGIPAAPNRVRSSNYCDIGVHLDYSGSTLIITSAIDNMVKGAAGQAVQNMNIIFGLDEKTGLGMIPSLF
ncbi:MAG: N-acetyl-gamma-glutamyl-phosphate reductase [Termitinemataceae bacterium]|nr:MAG: N-acetyl-gamma-glutamyl-phosphate reductase [Termitinemataceae bacterium]